MSALFIGANVDTPERPIVQAFAGDEHDEPRRLRSAPAMIGSNVDTDADAESLQWLHDRLGQEFEISGDLIARARRKKAAALDGAAFKSTNPQQGEENTMNITIPAPIDLEFTRDTDLDTDEPETFRSAALPSRVGDGPHLVDLDDDGSVHIAIAPRENTMSVAETREFAAEILAVAAAAEKATPKQIRRPAGVDEALQEAD